MASFRLSACSLDMDELEEQLKVLRLQLEQSRPQTAEAQQEMAAAEVQWEAQNTHLQQELRLSNVAAARAEVLAPAQRVYVQRERRFRKLCGQPQTAEDPDVDDWAADMESHLKASLLSDREGLNFIFDHLSGAAGLEVRFREPRTAAEALHIVQRVFGDVDTVGVAQEAFYTRIQQPGETLLDYSLALVKLFCKLSKRQPNLTALRDETLKGRFSAGVRDLHLQREMRRLELDESRMSFWEFRDRAISWLGKEIPKKVTSQNVVSALPGATTDSSGILKLLEAQQQQMQQMQDLLAKQQQQLDNGRYPRSWEARRQPKRGYNAKGERVCFLCGSEDHLSPTCPQKRNSQEN